MAENKPIPRMIVKIQWPLAGDTSHCLIYNEDQSFRTRVPVAWLEEVYNRNKPKQFFWAEVDEKNMLQLYDPVPDPGW